MPTIQYLRATASSRADKAKGLSALDMGTGGDTILDMRTQYRKTRQAWNTPGHAHFLTYSCFRRLPLLSRDRTRRWAVEALEDARRSFDVQLWAYVIMPEHVHVLLYPNNGTYDMSRILVALKRAVAVAARRHLVESRSTEWLRRLTVTYPKRSAFRFWQPGGGFDRNVFRERTVREVIDYIHANPVRRGLADSPTDWVWSSARFWDGCPEVPIRMDEPLV